MKKTQIATAVAFSLGIGIAQAATMTSATFTLLGSDGSIIGAPDPAVTGSIGSGTWSVASTTPFSGLLWTAHSGTTFGPGTYTIDTVEGGIYTNIVVGANQIGGHMLFNWAASTNIDVVQVWDFCNTCGAYTSTDIDGDGVHGIGMLDGPFATTNANFDFVVPVSAVPVPAAVWLFGSGLIGFLGMTARRKAT